MLESSVSPQEARSTEADVGQPAQASAKLKDILRYGLYPFLLLTTLGFSIWVVTVGKDLRYAFGWVMGARTMTVLALEFVYPMKREWRMTWRSFGRDLLYAAMNGGFGALIRWAAVFFAISIADDGAGWLEDAPLLVEVVVLALTFEFIQYWLHRISHEARGTLGKFLWRIHVAHHLPDRVYVLMHPVMHPFNLLFILFVTQGTLLLTGASAEAIFVFNALLSLHGLVSHFNFEISAGPLNYLFVGTELHRDHHSADPHESKNFGVLTPLWDLVFGTFHYNPGRTPKRLGVEHPEDYPDSLAIHKVIMLPLSKSSATSYSPTADCSARRPGTRHRI
jgi:sterol desaturase/sphingolipid hydroxylase (fatty acid hydroxylase superfamily)